MEQSCIQMPTIERIKSSLNKAGIVIDTAEPLFITPELQDCFLYSGKQRPEMYLSSAVRNGISFFHNFCSQSELNNGLKKLQEDIGSGDIYRVIKNFENEEGDYIFISSYGR